MTQLEHDIADWQEKHWPATTPGMKYRKLVEEVGELGTALIEGDLPHAALEAGDVGVALTGLLALIDIGSGPGSLTAWMYAAMEKNKTREEA